MNLGTQNERVLRHLMEHGTIDQGITLDWSPPITRLAARIADLKAAGNPVKQVGKAGKFARYGFVSPTKPGEAPPPPRPRCPECQNVLEDVKPTLAPSIVTGTCFRHGRQQAFVR